MATYNYYPNQPRGRQTYNYVDYPQNYMPQPSYRPQEPVSAPTPSTPLNLKGHFVASFDEVKAIPVDFDGSVSYFPDTANKRIYTKQIGADGSPVYGCYARCAIEEPANNNYITRDEFNAALNNLRYMWTYPQQQPNNGFTTTNQSISATDINSINTNQSVYNNNNNNSINTNQSVYNNNNNNSINTNQSDYNNNNNNSINTNQSDYNNQPANVNANNINTNHVELKPF